MPLPDDPAERLAELIPDMTEEESEAFLARMMAEAKRRGLVND